MANPVLAFDPKERKLILSALGKSCGNSILTDAEANVLERLATAIEAAAPEPLPSQVKAQFLQIAAMLDQPVQHTTSADAHACSILRGDAKIARDVARRYAEDR